MPPKTSKPTFKSTVPFTETRWPVLPSHVRDNILDLLCHLIQPLGDHRKTHIQPSKGKKRKRKHHEDQQTSSQSITGLGQHHDATATSTTSTNPPPPRPEIGAYIFIGLNSVTRHLEALVAQETRTALHPSKQETQASQPANTTIAPNPQDQPDRNQNQDGHGDKKKEDDASEQQPLPHFSLLIIPHSNPSSSLAHAHIPPLLALSNPSPASSRHHPRRTRLIALPTHTETLLSSALHIPRVGALGILEDAPGAEALVRYVEENVAEGEGTVECEWVKEAAASGWRGVKIVS